MRTPVKKEQGAILIMGVFILVILIGIAAFALDLGRLYVLRAEMQNSVDSAAISAASELDGEAGARDRAMTAANQEMLNHLAHFSKQRELLKDLQAENFNFYTWIGSNSDSAERPTDCIETADGKCEATGDSDASYVKIKLEPASADDDYYTVDLFFLPVLSLFSSESVATTASTRVEALAGTQLKVCNFPPLFICDPTEFGDPDLTPGQMVVLHEQGGPSAPWSSGTFGWLQPFELEKDPSDDGLGTNKLLAHRLGSKYGQQCTDTIEVKGGQIANWPRWGLNTRFGLYARPEHRNEYFPSAPNIVDYPRDDNLTLEDGGECGPSAQRFGTGNWNVTECNQQPSTFSRVDYNSNYHVGLVPNMSPRLEYYNWELSASGNLPKNTMDAATEIHADEQQCDAEKDKACRMLDGNPNELNISPNTIDFDDSDKRRELFVGAVACAANNVKANSILNIEQAGVRWMRFFMTEHVSPPAGSEGVTIHAEFIEEVPDEDGHFKKVIQLYE